MPTITWRVTRCWGAAGKLVLLFGIGAIAGPVVAGQMMEAFGNSAFFLFLGVVYGLIAVFALYRMTRRAALPLEEQSDFVLVSPADYSGCGNGDRH